MERIEKIVPIWRKELIEKFLKDSCKEKVLDTSQEEKEKAQKLVEEAIDLIRKYIV